MMASRYFACRGCGALALATAIGCQAAAHAQDAHAQDAHAQDAHAQDNGTLSIELNKMEDTQQGCMSSFLFDNRTGHQLNRFQIDLVFFDADGIAAKQLLLDMAPLYADKKMFASLLLDDTACDKIGSVLVNRVPVCEDGSGVDIGCVDLLEVSSRSQVPLER